MSVAIWYPPIDLPLCCASCSGGELSVGLEASTHQNSWKLSVLTLVSMILAFKLMETIGKTNGFKNFYDFWNYGLRALRVQLIVPEIMEIMETVGCTNSLLLVSMVLLPISWKHCLWQRSFAKIVVFQCL